MTESRPLHDQYLSHPRECDKQTLRLLAAHMPCVAPSVVDISCTSGLLVRLLKNAFPTWKIAGTEFEQRWLDYQQSAAHLADLHFSYFNLLEPVPNEMTHQFDAATTTAVTFQFLHEDFCRAIATIASLLKPGAIYVGFELITEFSQTLEILERTDDYPQGTRLVIRNVQSIEKVFKDAGFSIVEILPFSMPIDLPKPATHASLRLVDGISATAPHLASFTQLLANQIRLTFRGALFQPWCHIVAKKVDH